MNIYLAMLIMVAGLALHLGKKFLEEEDAGRSLSPIAYGKAHPWRIFVTVGSCVAMVFMLNWMDQLNEYAAFSTGFAGSSAFDALRTRANAKLGIEQPEQKQ